MTPAGAVPVPLTSLVGRQREIEAVGRLLAEHRLVTLVGAGGCGKSRLAVAVTGSVSAGSVCWIALAAMTDPALIPERIATAIGLRDRPGRSAADDVGEALRDVELVIVLDNCEHLLDGCAEIAELLLRRCPGVRILTTSREPLRIDGERRYPLSPLPVPDPVNPPPLEGLSRYDSVRLLVDRVHAVLPDFAVSGENAGAVVSICARLDGLPLAIELAAARANALTVTEIDRRLRSSFDLLATSGRRVLPQQRTMSATIDWSVRLLPDDERELLYRLAVFAGGFTLDGADAVTDVGGALDPLSRLVDRSLVLANREGGVTRYSMLETVRQYGVQHLTERDLSQVRRRHADHYLRVIAAVRPDFHTGGRPAALRRLSVEHDNLNAALTFTAGQAEPDDHLRLAGGLFFYWFMTGRLREGRRWLEAAIRLSSGRLDERPALMADVLAGAGLLAWTAGENTLGIEHLDRSIGMYARVGDDAGRAQALRFLSGIHESTGNLDRARSLVEESVELSRRAGDAFDLSLGLGRLGITAVSQRDFVVAFAALDEGLALCRASGDAWATALNLRHLGIAGLRGGEYRRARVALRESLELLRASADRFLSLQCFETLAAVDAAVGRHRTAALMLGALAAQRESIGVSVIYPEDLRLAESQARSRLGDGEFDRLAADGSLLTMDGLYELALGDRTDAESGPAETLTPREREILQLVARGLTNDRIARTLFVSSRTVNWHLTAIYAKLGVRGRTEATRVAIEQGLG